MSRLISTEMQAVSQAEVVRPFYLIDMEFSTPLRLWTGIGDLDVPTGDTLVTNGTFTGNADGWQLFASGTAQTVYSNNEILESGTNFTNRAEIRQTIPTIAGRKYRVNYDADGISHILMRDMVANSNIGGPVLKQAGGVVHTFTAVSASTRLTIRNQSGGTITVDNVGMYYNQTYVGLGELLKIGQIREATDLSANGTTVTLTGVKSSLIAVARDEDYQGKIATIKLGAMDELSNVITNPVQLFSGFMDVMVISDSGESSTINVSIENKLIAFDRAYVRRFTDGDQKIDYPSDKGFEFVTSIQELEIIWGRPSPRDS